MTEETGRIKIRELDPVDAGNLRTTDQLAVAVGGPDRTLRTSIKDVVDAGLSLQEGDNITVTKIDGGYRISAATQGFDSTALETRIKRLEDQIATLAQGSKVTATQTPPAGAKTGDLWWDTNTARMYIYFNSVWVQSNPTGDSPITIEASGGAAYDDQELRGLIAANQAKIIHLENSTNTTTQGVVATGVINLVPFQSSSGSWSDLPGYTFQPGDVAVVTGVKGASFSGYNTKQAGGGLQTRTYNYDVTVNSEDGTWTATGSGSTEKISNFNTVTIDRSAYFTLTVSR